MTISRHQRLRTTQLEQIKEKKGFWGFGFVWGDVINSVLVRVSNHSREMFWMHSCASISDLNERGKVSFAQAGLRGFPCSYEKRRQV